MREIKGDIWSFYRQGHWIVIPTNGYVRKDGCAVMGRGLALQAVKKYPQLPKTLGNVLSERGNHVYSFGSRLITFPVKHRWYEPADPELIKKSVKELLSLWQGPNNLYLPRVGCGNGRLSWSLVKPLLKDLDDRFTVVEYA